MGRSPEDPQAYAARAEGEYVAIMPQRVVAVYQGKLVGRFHGPYASHVAVIVLPGGRIHCRGWGLRVEAEAALERARDVEGEIPYAAVHETQLDDEPSRRLVRMDPQARRRQRRVSRRPLVRRRVTSRRGDATRLLTYPTRRATTATCH